MESAKARAGFLRAAIAPQEFSVRVVRSASCGALMGWASVGSLAEELDKPQYNTEGELSCHKNTCLT